ncbi:hypothetical protein A4249_07125 [Brevundimonas sp. GW460-12-10-14-LB2]|uniref:hypothetical protein n=1 Tax=Brevundimonas sp. GW460-12-10-14-LB2 TaxID=1827469 RepID=UPI0007BC9CD7|nr:hypothetical protein [Brevundimonas sp. GW460-12-10-14-LB2]ANC53449.1 hypothetical protein A4249_07125 [Brevundimonas sp. GW460-12-10-14-LB2]
MTTQARVIGPASELGHFDTLNFFGNEIGREFTDVTLTPDQLRKAEGNPYIEIKGADDALSDEDLRKAKEDEAEAEKIRARLAELDMTVDGRASLKTLRGKLDAAEKAEAKRLEDEAEAARKAAEGSED